MLSMSEENFKRDLTYFINNAIKIKNNPYEASFLTFQGTLNGVKYISSFGKGNFANVPWIAFLDFKQDVSKGIYPVILYNTRDNYNNFEICYGISSYNKPNSNWNSKYIANLPHSNTKKYNESFVKKAYTINSIDDLNLNIENIKLDLDCIIRDFKENFSNYNENNTTNYNFHFYADKNIPPQKHSPSEELKIANKKTVQPLNQILYGPPGTGKTYSTVIKAVEITEPELIQRDASGNVLNYNVLKNKFDELKKQGQIEFVTFHQSYSYEEFVEGIKPEILKWNDEASELKYVGKDGVFKNICEHAKPIMISSTKHPPIDFSNTKVFKMSLGNTLEKEEDIYDYCISNNVIALGFKDVDFSNCKTSQDFKNQDDSWGSVALERFVNWMDVGDIVIISNGNKNFRAIAQVKSDYYYDRTTPIKYSHFRKVEWLYKGDDIYYSKINNKVFSQQSIYGYFDSNKKGEPDYNPDLNTEELNNIITGKVDKEIALPHILIIDEINRGNISKIFGELITLIEEDKREILSVKLPYSQDNFTVPKNLYILGTMNTSDRSIASIDIALRRRFKFIEMMPKPELVADFGCNFKNIFEKLNTKIKILLDRDHQIGHSYFINTKYENADIKTLKEIWFSEIIPLLNEYFYCDWEKLKLIIPGFIKPVDVPTELKNECEETMYEFKTPDEIQDFEGALKQEKYEQES